MTVGLERLDMNTPKGVAASAAESLRRAIVQGTLPPGTHLVEAALAKELGVSTTPVREAIMSLARKGLVTVLPYRGSYVTEITPIFVDELLTLRAELETFAAGRAIDHLTDEDFQEMVEHSEKMEEYTQASRYHDVVEHDAVFHRRIYEQSNNSMLLEVWDSIQPRVQFIQAYGRLYKTHFPDGFVRRSHLEIVNVLRTRDLSVIEPAIHKHIESGRTVIERLNESDPPKTFSAR